ncbi:hypothetical protein [Bacteroides thetaiotaomicron]
MNKIWGDFQLLEWCWLTCGMVLADRGRNLNSVPKQLSLYYG